MDSNLSTSFQRLQLYFLSFLQKLVRLELRLDTFEIETWQTTVQFLVVFHGKLPLFATSSGQGQCLLLIKEVQ